MNQLTYLHLIGVILTLSIIMGVGIYFGKKIKSASDFSTGGRNASSTIVAGTIVGTLVGGSSTIGTAQLAYIYGLSAWWFTIGAGIGCVIMAIIFIKPIRISNCSTIQQIISNEYGQTSGIVTSVLNTLGIILNIVAQILAANALLTTMFGIGPIESAIISVILMTCYVVFGGVLGTGVLGIIKLILIYIAVIFGAFTVLKLSGGFLNIYNTLPHEEYFNLFSRGFGVDVGAGFSVVLGVLSTQTYIQAVICAKSNKAAKTGALVSAVMIPPIGIGGILIGMYMRINYPYINPGQAFPFFIINNIHPFLGGVILATLLIAIVGTGSGMALGFGTIVTNDIYKKFINKNANSNNELFVTRMVIIISLIVSAIFTIGNLKSTILTWGFMSMGLRATVLLVPLCGALFFKGKIYRAFAIMSSVLGLSTFVLSDIFIDINFDPLFIGMLVSLIVAVIGSCLNRSGFLKNK